MRNYQEALANLASAMAFTSGLDHETTEHIVRWLEEDGVLDYDIVKEIYLEPETVLDFDNNNEVDNVVAFTQPA